ncbi:hypothetical protein BHAOGJBA_0409 [Methylobacterium hispanicum]|uniref:Tyrosine specific protein phosphatases domain-containing protein n=1 Tax=Methylobacterium hispanicum TaxID=270350 RepID=A0AAV4ZFM3_9HYPH|nr:MULTISPECIES: ADP-ribosylglycohydrolase family protein [Methylobacterium]GJD86911.1 hypothetical protein BHAOGJBA_0409 [Methylobacterium hispanicum]
MTKTPDTPLRIAEIAVGRAGGRIGVTFAPGKRQPFGLTGPHRRDLGADLDVIAAWNAAAVVTLMEAHELTRVRIASIGDEVRRRHMEWHHAPIVDVSVPDAAFEAGWPTLSARLRGLLARGAHVLVHCRGGLGRAGMVAARLLVETGLDAEAAMAAVRAVRPGAIETPAQARWVAAGRGRPLPPPSTGIAAMRDRAVGALVGLAIGDALGTTIEFSPKPRRAVLTTITGGSPFRLAPGQWTDDTALALALADSLVHDPGLDARDLMNRFTAWYRRGEYSCTGACFDIGNATRAALARYEQTGDPVAGSTSEAASGNGALMRLAPAAIRHWREAETLRAVADRQTRTTHGSPSALRCSRQLADLLARAIGGVPLHAVLGSETGEAIEGGWRGVPRAAIEGSGYVVRALQAAVWAVARTTDFRSAVLLAANLGDDADSTAAIAGQLAGAVYGLAGIPGEWLAVLAWRERIESVAAQLFEAGCPREQAPGPSSERLCETGEGARILRTGIGEMVFRDGRLVPKHTLDRSAEPAATDAAHPGAAAGWPRAVDEFVAFWSRLEGAGVHSDDRGQIPGNDFALGLHPVPWAGPLRSARAYILVLNPGLSEDDATQEARPAFAAALRANLAGDQPYLYLLDEHATHPGHRWARRTFGPDITQADAADICMLPLVPYHSREGAVARRVAPALASSRAVRRFVRDGLLPHVRAGHAVLIVARSARLWDITDEEPGVVIYTSSEPRRAFQTRQTRGGVLLRRVLGRSG